MFYNARAVQFPIDGKECVQVASSIDLREEHVKDTLDFVFGNRISRVIIIEYRKHMTHQGDGSFLPFFHHIHSLPSLRIDSLHPRAQSSSLLLFYMPTSCSVKRGSIKERLMASASLPATDKESVAEGAVTWRHARPAAAHARLRAPTYGQAPLTQDACAKAVLTMQKK